ncbi:MAG: hypothetical protein GY785_01195 [Gammaproteobacteria bacterium]|nr:hypothetical protein [Gammaproteobacteria bacterium]MCP4981552.1 hypothetical protein [Gammaproteobacteria bacterium]
MAIKSNKPTTQRQRYWLDHLNATAAGGTSLADYARNNQLKPKELYAWKTRLISLGHLPGEPNEKKRGISCI